MMQLHQVTQAVKGTQHGANVTLSKVMINGRSDCEGALFVALKGDNHDAHDYIYQAEKSGAVAVLVDHLIETDLPQVVVENTHTALTQLATWWRQQFILPVIAVTGSVGKTTVKEMLANILQQVGANLVTKGNLNNEIGVPLTILRLKSHHQYAVIEMGMNHAGEIDRLSRMSQPHVALINNAGAAHLQGLGSVDAVAKAKAEIFNGLNDEGIAVIPFEDAYSDYWRGLLGEKKVISFGLNVNANVSAQIEDMKTAYRMKICYKPEGREVSTFDVVINTLGEHNVLNALAAVAVSLSANVPMRAIQSGLQNSYSIKGRLQLTQYQKQNQIVQLIDDSYNANPMSMLAAIKVLAQFDNTLLIVGDMGELGSQVQSAHQQVGLQATQYDIKSIVACGQYADDVIKQFQAEKASFTKQEHLIDSLKEIDLSQYNAILVKGSRSAKMENVVDAIKNQLMVADSGFSVSSNQRTLRGGAC